MMALRLVMLALATTLSIPVHADEPYRLGVQDRLRIHVHEWPILTGDFPVGPNGSVTMPLIGEVPAIGLQPSELAVAIAERLRTKVALTQVPETAVDVSQFRPFYITGGVERPGEYTYRPGMIVLNALTIAGGVYRPQRSSDWGFERDAITGRGDMRVAMVRSLELKARALRLHAEAEGWEEIGPPPPTFPREAIRFLDEERKVFAADKERLNNQVKSFDDAIVLLDGEIEALRQQIKASQKMGESVARELEETKNLVARGLAPAPRVLPLERTIAQIESEQKALETAILRARQQINQNKAQRFGVIDQRRSLSRAALQALDASIEEQEERHNTATSLVSGSLSAGSVAPSGELGDNAPGLSFTIVRQVGADIREFAASETTRVQPGDIVKVLRPQEIRRVRTSTAPN